MGKLKYFYRMLMTATCFLLKGRDEINRQVVDNRKKFFEKCGIDPSRLVNLKAVHGNKIFLAGKNDLGKGALDDDTRIAGVDGLLSKLSNSYLMVTGADCFPILFYDEKNRGHRRRARRLEGSY